MAITVSVFLLAKKENIKVTHELLNQNFKEKEEFLMNIEADEEQMVIISQSDKSFSLVDQKALKLLQNFNVKTVETNLKEIQSWAN
jgi:hypothetical protein